MGQFCYWDARSLPDAIILAVILAFSVGIFCVSLYRLKTIRKYGDHGRRIIRIYILILFWAVGNSYQNLYAVSIFFSVIYDDYNNDYYNIDITPYSKSYVRLDYVACFIVQTIFLQICKLFFKGLTSTVPLSIMPKWEQQFTTKPLLKIYCYIRIVIMGISIILINIFAQNDTLVPIFLDVCIWALVVDCIITNIFLLLSLKIFTVRWPQAGGLQEKDMQKLKRQYTIMIMTSMLRILLDVTFLIVSPRVHLIGSGRCLGPFLDHYIRTICYVCVANILNHLLPVIWFMKIYNIGNSSAYEEEPITDSSSSSQRFQLIRSILE